MKYANAKMKAKDVKEKNSLQKDTKCLSIEDSSPYASLTRDSLPLYPSIKKFSPSYPYIKDSLPSPLP
uniref:Uncharacterized protein n=1 Tax=Moniliophthora roreri TaxID=221103 RepID=A0A0W0FNQ6_MONRR